MQIELFFRSEVSADKYRMLRTLMMSAIASEVSDASEMMSDASEMSEAAEMKSNSSEMMPIAQMAVKVAAQVLSDAAAVMPVI